MHKKKGIRYFKTKKSVDLDSNVITSGTSLGDNQRAEKISDLYEYDTVPPAYKNEKINWNQVWKYLTFTLGALTLLVPAILYFTSLNSKVEDVKERLSNIKQGIDKLIENSIRQDEYIRNSREAPSQKKP